MTKIQDMANRINESSADKETKVKEKELMMHIVNGLPRMYDIEVSKFEDLLEENKLTIEKIRSSLSLRYEKNKDKESDDEEKALYGNKQFKGRCNKCGAYGHKGADCTKTSQQTNGNKGKFPGKCHYCKKYGHKILDCLKQKNG